MSKPARRRRVGGHAGYAAAWNYDPKARLRELIDHLMNVPGPASIDDLPAEKKADGLVIVVDAKVVDDLNVAAGKEDLRSYAETLFGALDAISDVDERDRAYEALHRVANAIFLIAKSGADPFRELRSQNKQTAAMRAPRNKKFAERDEFILSVVDKYKRSKPRASTGSVLDHVKGELAKNVGLVKKGLGKIEERTLYRILERRLPRK